MCGTEIIHVGMITYVTLCQTVARYFSSCSKVTESATVIS